MRACEDYMDLMIKSIDGETSQQEDAALHAHLGCCEACRALYEAYQMVDRSIESTEEEPPEHLTGAIMNSIRREKAQAQPKHWFQRYKFTMIAAAAAVVILISARLGGNYDAQSISVTSDSAAAEAAAVPEAEAEFRSAAQENTVATGAEAEAEAPEMAMAEEAAPAEEAAKTEADAGEPQMQESGSQSADQNLSGTAETDDGISTDFGADRVTALENAGCYGYAVLVSGVDEQALWQLLPEITAVVVLDNGEMAYEASKADVEAAAAQGNLSIVADYMPDEPEQTDVCWIILY